MPSITHMALVELEKAGILKFVISQNVDSLHLRSGIPREKLAELHGNSFREICPSCGVEYLCDFEIETIGMKKTPRRCSDVKCGSRLKDTVLDWEMNPAEENCRMADVVLCLGTSLQITPACNLPLKSLRGGGKIVIVNLQQTPKDKKVSLVVHAPLDKVIAGVMHHLTLWIPPYVRVDLFQINLDQYSRPSQSEQYRQVCEMGSQGRQCSWTQSSIALRPISRVARLHLHTSTRQISTPHHHCLKHHQLHVICLYTATVSRYHRDTTSSIVFPIYLRDVRDHCAACLRDTPPPCSTAFIMPSCLRHF